ncbi:hypothetical protein HHX47_DHR6000559 [Lentinula edodes]|nr:hypothetical protein HHX47_DHR6000559 [Lentinula edodes]
MLDSLHFRSGYCAKMMKIDGRCFVKNWTLFQCCRKWMVKIQGIRRSIDQSAMKAQIQSL